MNKINYILAAVLASCCFCSQTTYAQNVSTYTELTSAIKSLTGDTEINVLQDINADSAMGTLGRTPMSIIGGGGCLFSER